MRALAERREAEAAQAQPWQPPHRDHPSALAPIPVDTDDDSQPLPATSPTRPDLAPSAAPSHPSDATTAPTSGHVHRSLLWADAVAPEDPSDVCGNEEAAESLCAWLFTGFTG